jgi:hypothetical protein
VLCGAVRRCAGWCEGIEGLDLLVSRRVITTASWLKFVYAKKTTEGHEIVSSMSLSPQLRYPSSRH